jgi:hypothetical protein
MLHGSHCVNRSRNCSGVREVCSIRICFSISEESIKSRSSFSPARAAGYPARIFQAARVFWRGIARSYSSTTAAFLQRIYPAMTDIIVRPGQPSPV